jgi:hypothetical protein
MRYNKFFYALGRWQRHGGNFHFLSHACQAS